MPVPTYTETNPKPGWHFEPPPKVSLLAQCFNVFCWLGALYVVVQVARAWVWGCFR